ncbi:hypothetical protein [Arthrobacter sp. BF1]|nr:hypothetical protein [Arthrobacter sp. BF1]
MPESGGSIFNELEGRQLAARIIAQPALDLHDLGIYSAAAGALRQTSA